MRLALITDFGLRAPMRLAGEPDRTFSTDDIACEFNVSCNHLTKIVQALSNGGIAVTRRAKNAEA